MADHDIGIAEYEHCRNLSCSRWAWEFLRRNPGFIRDAARHAPDEISIRPGCNGVTLIRPRTDQMDAERWGLAFFPEPHLNGYDANVFWSGGLYPRQVHVHVSPRLSREVCEIFEVTTRDCSVFHLIDTAGREHLLVKGNGHVVQVRCSGMSLLSMEPVKMQFVIEGVERFEERYRILKQAHRIVETTTSAPAPQWTRNSLLLRNALIAFDCRQAGLSLRDTAAVIYGKPRAERAWSSSSRAMKDEIRRARDRGIELVNAGYRALLTYPASASLAA